MKVLTKEQIDQKRAYQEVAAKQRDSLCRAPFLRYLFFELTMRCNENCLHCGSRCGDIQSKELPLSVYQQILDEVKAEFSPHLPQICITGGEPLLRRDFFEILSYARDLGFSWGMTSNGTLITKEVAEKLADAGMRTVSISLDGLREQNDMLRRTPGGFDLALQGIQNLVELKAFQHVQVTTVVHHRNIGDLPELFRLLNGIEIDSWRVVNMEPIGRALKHPDLMLTKEDYRRLFAFIREKRENDYPVCYGCSHYLGTETEAEVRDWYYLCMAGINTASIMANGDVGACLDIERRPETVQGNIFKDRFTEIWRNRFEIFRTDITERSEKCRVCPERRFCAGDSRHSWDYDKNEPLLCFKGTLWND